MASGWQHSLHAYWTGFHSAEVGTSNLEWDLLKARLPDLTPSCQQFPGPVHRISVGPVVLLGFLCPEAPVLRFPVDQTSLPGVRVPLVMVAGTEKLPSPPSATGSCSASVLIKHLLQATIH